MSVAATPQGPSCELAFAVSAPFLRMSTVGVLLPNCGEYLVISIKVGGPLSSGGPEGDDEGLSLVTYWPNT